MLLISSIAQFVLWYSLSLKKKLHISEKLIGAVVFDILNNKQKYNYFLFIIFVLIWHSTLKHFRRNCRLVLRRNTYQLINYKYFKHLHLFCLHKSQSSKLTNSTIIIQFEFQVSTNITPRCLIVSINLINGTKDINYNLKIIYCFVMLQFGYNTVVFFKAKKYEIRHFLYQILNIFKNLLCFFSLLLTCKENRI